MKDLLRDAPVGQILNWLSAGAILPYADQRPEYVLPLDFSESKLSKIVNDAPQVPTLRPSSSITEVNAEVIPSPYLVTWDGPQDPDNPKNWSLTKRVFVAGLISFYTCTIYIGSAIFTPAIPDLIEVFGTTEVIANLGLTLFVFGYGIGPMFLAPLQELPTWGRSPAYLAGLVLYVLFQMPPLVGKNIETLLIFRFAAGFVGSPALATGGATLGDMFPPHQMPYAIGAWSIGAVAGPITGPVIGGFATQAGGFRWPFYEMLALSSFCLVLLALFFPETLPETILQRRAARIRKLTGNPLFRSASELEDGGNEVFKNLWKHFKLAILLCFEPAVAFANTYMAFVYSVFYLWFTAFPIVFQEIHHFNLGLSGLPFLGFLVSGCLVFAGYVLYFKYLAGPQMMRNPNLPPERRLELAIVGGMFIPVSLLLFGWSSRASVHWMVPIVGSALYLPGIYLTFQSILLYLGMAYPTHILPLYAGNDLFRSSIASAFPLFGTFFFRRLGLGGGCTFLAGISVIMLPVFYLLMIYGPKLRARSKY